MVVVGAYLLALVAAEEVVADHCGLFGGEFPFQLYGEVGDASGCVEFAGFDEGSGWAAFEAVAAASTEVWEGWLVVGYLLVDKNFSEKKIRSSGRNDEEAVFSGFSDAGVFGPGFFKHRGAVNSYYCVELFSEKGFQ